MKVLFLPDWSSGNPYQQKLAEALERCGVRVTLGDGIGRLPILGAIWTYRPDILHLHWTQPFSIRSKRVKSAMAILRFVIELLTARLLGFKLVWTVHNLFQHERAVLLE